MSECRTRSIKVVSLYRLLTLSHTFNLQAQAAWLSVKSYATSMQRSPANTHKRLIHCPFPCSPPQASCSLCTAGKYSAVCADFLGLLFHVAPTHTTQLLLKELGFGIGKILKIISVNKQSTYIKMMLVIIILASTAFMPI